MRSVRIYFSKTGDAKYISHLDLVRCFNRAVARAGIPIFFTEGFNPGPYMTLSVKSTGLIPNCEFEGRTNVMMRYTALSHRLCRRT